MSNKTEKPSYEDDGLIKVGLPKADLTLFLGIASIITCFALGITGLVLGIMARNISKEPMELYQLAPELYTEYSHKNIKTGRTCAKIGIILSSVFLFFVLVYFFLRGVILSIF